MFITVKEALQLNELREFRLVAGKAGVSNKIYKVGILDHEIGEVIEKSFIEGEFVLSTLLVIKDKIEQLYNIVEKLILVGASGLAIKTIYFNEIPNEIIHFANSRDFPLFIFDKVYFEDIITIIIDTINKKKDNTEIELKIDNILYSNLNSLMIKKIAYEFNRDFKEKHIVIFCKRKNKGKDTNPISLNIAKDNNLNKSNKIIFYKEGYLIIDTFEKIEYKKMKERILTRLDILGFNAKEYDIGISSFHEKLEELNFSIKESMYALKHARIYGKNISFFRELGSDRILLPLMENHWVQKYYEEMIMPLLTYDKRNDAELLKTARIYIQNNGNIKAVAREMLQHDNTIRYRINKIYTILSKSYEIKHLYEELAIAIRIHNLMDISL